MPTYRGSWRLTVVGKEAAWPQRVVISGSVSGIVPGEPGRTVVIAGDEWHLVVEHDDGGGWKRSAQVIQRPLNRTGDQASQVIVSKDRFWAHDSTPDDLVVSLETVGGPLSVGKLFAADADRLTPRGSGSLRSGDGEQLLGVEITNTGFESFGYDAVLDISPRGRSELAGCGVLVQDKWRPALLRATGQEVFEGAVSVPPLEVGESTTVYFPVDCAQASSAAPEVEFELRHRSGVRSLRSYGTASITVEGRAKDHRDGGAASPTEQPRGLAHPAASPALRQEPGRAAGHSTA
ncbi:hypothetical protein A8924_5871 [Saccharopolyspora erythraea NRRL 2338]|uniref:Uncharacterized protein n=2 Tax=Saccharopolyspora erythraea TaxID=1836 RepID=A4FKZ5_SACEN|nr:hypothetical protein [Saccharopolyspora erythraea]PFG98359.1 hypothetical protein A8924_5871 [Saccharopolyspora erythraea NRRL 2338]QRK88431.1 hypothetical protein JQX30_27740 [Saccharopolyspora erythraea]CAM04720.1 hypothetical protein SACE_5533 [Saccharopolyspora erythraea NRRL 2338]